MKIGVLGSGLMGGKLGILFTDDETAVVGVHRERAAVAGEHSMTSRSGSDFNLVRVTSQPFRQRPRLRTG
jgi:6-phosphogluconate dehydrogenase (decarboxylating)